ncbi:MAG: L,D-transpeptidase family protein [Pseudomonadota bacterium]
MAATTIRPATLFIAIAALAASLSFGAPARAQVTAYMQSVAEAAASDRDLAAFYRSNAYQPIWTGDDALSKQRREALLRALQDAPVHGLPIGRYDLDGLDLNLRQITSERALGQAEVEMTKLFLQYARDVQTGLLNPKSVDSGIVREVPHRDRDDLLAAFAKSNASAFLRSLPPQTPEYARLMKEKMRYEALIAGGGWGEQVNARKLEPGDSGKAVVQLRNRLIAQGYMPRSATSTYDTKMRQAVSAFQSDHGLISDGVAGANTIKEINASAEKRLSQVLVAMERERWTNMPRGERHIWVNITDFQAKIIDDGKVTFATKSVVGHRDLDRRTPEFSDVMEHMVINPTWNVPRSIATKEYLPLLQQNPYAVSHLKLINRRGQVVSRERVVDFNQFTARNFPFDMKQAPGRSNALGLVKFMFPNRHNIYLHDTPAKKLFGRDVRAFSHGCVRLNDPFDFAYALLAKQEEDPKGTFQRILGTGRETQVDLVKQVPVHIVYRTAYTQAKGRTQFRIDVYGRDARIWNALEAAGVSLATGQG